MKSKAVELGSKKVLHFPKLMISCTSSAIVLFEENKKGQIVSGVTIGKGLGWYYEDWNMDFFQDFNGTVELSNE
jgi:hypothetical protein